MAKMLLVERCLDCTCRDDDHSNDRGESWCTISEDQGNIEDVSAIATWCRLLDAPRWVPVSERLPPESEVYNVRVNYGGQYYRDSTRWDATEQMWLVPREWQIYLAEGRVTHWLAGMPPLPKEEVSDAEEEVSDAE